jgi:Tol biopolymer transport system component
MEMAMTDAWRPSGRVWLAAGFLLLAPTSWIACRDGASITAPNGAGATVVVSDPALAGPQTTAAAAGRSRNAVGVADAEVAYVSLPPASLSDAALATVINTSTNARSTVTLIDGGFDPLAIVAAVGDTISVQVEGGREEPMKLVVPARRPPQVVRPYPSGGKRDVALNSRILIVFSEPIDRQSVNSSTVQLLRAGTVVPGSLEFGDIAGLTVSFRPDAPLVANADYEIVVSDNVRDRSGDHLVSPVTVTFTTSASAGASPSLERIAFYDVQAIYVINADGSGLVKLIDGESPDFSVTHPAWSPDAAKITFGASRNGNWDVYVMNADGSNVTRLTTDPSVDFAPDWSRDGKQIVFSSTRDGWRHIYVMNADGTDVKRVTNDPANDNNPVWSPDGTKIAFASDRDEPGNTEIYVMNADGSSIKRLTVDPDPNDMPDWSPDGSRIAYHRFEPLGTGAVYVMNSDGSGVSRLTDGGGAPSWSPDGKHIVYSGIFLYIMNPNGSGAKKITFSAGFEPAWAPRDPQ